MAVGSIALLGGCRLGWRLLCRLWLGGLGGLGLGVLLDFVSAGFAFCHLLFRGRLHCLRWLRLGLGLLQEGSAGSRVDG